MIEQTALKIIKKDLEKISYDIQCIAQKLYEYEKQMIAKGEINMGIRPVCYKCKQVFSNYTVLNEHIKNCNEYFVG